MNMIQKTQVQTKKMSRTVSMATTKRRKVLQNKTLKE